MLDAKTEKYTHPGRPPAQDSAGFYFPDAVIDAFAARISASPPPPDTAPPLRITLEEAKHLITSAVARFDPAMAQDVADILKTANPGPPPGDFRDNAAYVPTVAEGSRWNLSLTDRTDGILMRCLPAQSPGSAYDPPNPRDYAVIEYQFNGTLDSAIYMAHEIGHCLADDATRKAGYTHGDSAQNLAETQAYFLQHIVYDGLMAHDDPATAAAAKSHFTRTMDGNARTMAHGLAALKAGDTPDTRGAVESIHFRPAALFTARALVDQASDGADRKAVADAVLGVGGPAPICAILDKAGLSTPQDMDNAAQRVLPGAKASLLIDVQLGCLAYMTPDDAKTYLDDLAGSLKDMREEGPVCWVTIGDRTRLFEPEGGAAPRDAAQLQDMDFFAARAADPQTEKAFRDFMAEHGPRKDEAVLCKYFKSAFAEPGDTEGRPDYQAKLERERGTAFKDAPEGALSQDSLAGYLKSQGVTRLDVMGMVSNHCVCETAAGAAAKGFETRILTDRVVSWKGDDNAPGYHQGPDRRLAYAGVDHAAKIEAELRHIAADPANGLSGDQKAALAGITLTRTDPAAATAAIPAAIPVAPPVASADAVLLGGSSGATCARTAASIIKPAPVAAAPAVTGGFRPAAPKR